MKLNVSINRHTTTSELINLGMLFTALGLNTGAKVFAAPTDAAELDEPEVTHVAVSPEQEVAGNETPKRRRRTKDELRVDAIVAENARVAAAEAEAQASNEAAQIAGSVMMAGLKAIDTDPHQTLVEEAAEKAGAVATGEAGNVQPAPTPTVPETTTGAAEAPATASPSDAGKTYTPAEVQGLAVDTARRYGPEKVKALIATYPGVAKIAELPESELPGFVAKLQAITA